MKKKNCDFLGPHWGAQRGSGEYTADRSQATEDWGQGGEVTEENDRKINDGVDGEKSARNNKVGYITEDHQGD